MPEFRFTIGRLQKTKSFSPDGAPFSCRYGGGHAGNSRLEVDKVTDEDPGADPAPSSQKSILCEDGPRHVKTVVDALGKRLVTGHATA